MPKPRKPKPYYSLIVKHEDGRWYPQFGDYDKMAVEAERIEHRREHRAYNIRIIKTPDALKATVEAALRDINREAHP